MQNSPESLDRQRFLRAVAALAAMLLALVLLPVLAGRLKTARLPDIERPTVVCSEWIQPGSTNPPIWLNYRFQVIWSMQQLATPVELDIEEIFANAAPETPVPAPTAEQIEVISDRLQK